jgi:hypothetical protein
MLTDLEFVRLMRLILARKLPKVLSNLVLSFASPANVSLKEMIHSRINSYWKFLVGDFDRPSILYMPVADLRYYGLGSSASAKRYSEESFLAYKFEGNCRQPTDMDYRDHECNPNRPNCRNARNLRFADRQRLYFPSYTNNQISNMARWINGQEFTDSVYYTADYQYDRWRRRNAGSISRQSAGSVPTAATAAALTPEGYNRVDIYVCKRR